MVKEKNIVQDISECLNHCENYYSDIYEQAIHDKKFAYGLNQWSEAELASRKGKVNLTLNQLLPYGHQVVNDIKKMSMNIKVSPYDDMADLETANVLQDAIRSVERYSNANDAYNSAVMNAVFAGIGFIEISTYYAHEFSFDIEPKIERILDFSSIYLDTESTKLNGSDCEYAIKFVDIPEDKFKEQYPNIQPVSYDIMNHEKWKQDNTLRIADYYVKERKKDKIYKIKIDDKIDSIINIVNRKELKLLKDRNLDFEILEERDTFFNNVKIYKTNGVEIIEESDFPSQYIPIVPVYGEEVFIDGKHYGQSLIRQAIDGQRAYNFWKSFVVEMIALQPRTPFVGAVGSFKTFQAHWEVANKSNLPYLEYDIVHDRQGNRVEPPRRESSPQISPAILQESMSAKDDIRQAIGMYEAGLGQQGNEISGIAVKYRQIKGENSTYHFVDNLASSISHVGCILVDMIPQLYSDRQWLRIAGIDGIERKVPINRAFKRQGDEYRIAEIGETPDGIYNIGLGKYDVVCDVGGSYASERQEMADKLIQITSANPEIMNYVADLLFSALDLPMSEEIAERIRSQMPPELLGDDPMAMKLGEAMQSMAAMEEQLRNYEALLQDKSAKEDMDRQIKMGELALEKQDLAIKQEKTKAEVEKIRADALKVLKEMGNTDNDMINTLQEQISMLSNAISDIVDVLDEEEDGNEPAYKGSEMLKEERENE